MNTKLAEPRSKSHQVAFTLALSMFGSLALTAATYRETVLADNPVAYYRLEEAAGSASAADSGPTGAFPGTFFSADGVIPTLGLPGIDVNSVYFNSYKDAEGSFQYSYVEIPYALELNPQGPFSVEAWVRPSSVPTDGSYRSPFGNFGGWGAGATGWFFYQTPESAGNASVWVWVIQSSGVWIQSSRPIAKNQWDHLAATYNGSVTSFYVNGQLIGSSPASAYVASSATSTFIGAGPTGEWLFDGNVDEAAIYGATLTPEQISNHYQAGLASFRVENSGPVIIQSPAAATAYAGRTAKFAVGADGTAPLSYQWFKGNSPIAAATNDAVILEAALADNGALVKVVITNPYGTASSVAVPLTVSTDLILGPSPASITRTVGSAVAFRVGADGAWPIAFQWFKGTSALPGATNQTLWLENIQATDDGSTYYARTTNPWNTKDSEMAVLTVISRATTVPMTGYAKVVLADRPIGYWRLNEAAGTETAVDAVGSFDGIFDAGSTGVVTYAVATGIPTETDKAVSLAGGARVVVPYALEMNPHGPFTAEAWVQPASVAADSQDYRTAFSSEGSGPTGWLLYQQPDNTWAWVIFNDNWVSSWIYDVDDVITAGTWYHLVLVHEGTDFFLYVNGQLRGTKSWDAFIPNRDGQANFGWRSDNDWKPFQGAIDDVAFYNKSLSAGQVQAHYQASVRLNVTREGNNILLSWPFGVLQEAGTVAGSYADVVGASSPATITPGSSTKFYRLHLP